jgi:hypothetical protein
VFVFEVEDLAGGGASLFSMAQTMTLIAHAIASADSSLEMFQACR